MQRIPSLKDSAPTEAKSLEEAVFLEMGNLWGICRIWEFLLEMLVFQSIACCNILSKKVQHIERGSHENEGPSKIGNELIF